MLPPMTAGSPGRADLHSHTDRSDGNDSPQDVAAFAAALGLDVLAVTDHDTLDGAFRAADHSAASGGPEVVIGEEVTSRDGHIIGLFLFAGRSAVELRAALAAGEVAVTGRLPDPALLWRYLSWVSRRRPRPRTRPQVASLGRP